MDADIKSKWIAALRSGEYQQGTAQLMQDHPDGYKFCCLGVLCDIIDKEGWDLDHPTHRNCAALPSREILRKADIPMTEAEYLAVYNDFEAWSFNRIADYIEENL